MDNTIQPDGSRVLNDTGKKEIGDLPKIANGNQVLYYPGFPEQPKVMQDVIQTMLAVGVSNPALTAVSNTWNSKSKVLNQLVEDRIVRIVTGADSIDALDTLVKDKVIHCLTRDGEASCSAGGQDLGLAMLAQGQAVASQNRPTSAAYRKAAAQAKAQKRGLWHGSFIDPEAWDAAVGQNPMVRRP